MDHSVPAEPVVVGLVGRDHRRVGAVPQQPALEIGRDDAGDRQVDIVVPFLEHRREVPLEIRVGHRAVLGRAWGWGRAAPERSGRCAEPGGRLGSATPLRADPRRVGAAPGSVERSRSVTWQAEAMAQLAEDLRFRGLIHQLTDTELEKRLDADQLTAYSGFDPTADSMHVGHLLQVCNLRRLQLAGHRPIAVAGGGTGFVGDPGGKSEERSLLSEEELQANLEGIRGQLSASSISAGTGSGRALLVNNADWLRPCRSSSSCGTWASTSPSTRWWPRTR